MKRSIRAILYAMGSIGLSLLAAFAYFSRSQTIDFSTMLPVSLEICSRSMGPETPQYIELQAWLSRNPEGWHNSVADYAYDFFASGERINIALQESFVIVNYTRDGKTWHQVTRPKLKNELKLKCTS